MLRIFAIICLKNACQYASECKSTCTRNFIIHVNTKYMSTCKKLHVNIQKNACQVAFERSTCISAKKNRMLTFFPNMHVREKSYVNMRHLFLMRSLEKVAGEAEGENGNWKIKLIIFVGGTSGSTGECTDFVFERELFIGTQFSILYTSVYPPVKGRVSMIVLRNFKSWSPKKCNQKRFGLWVAEHARHGPMLVFRTEIGGAEWLSKPRRCIAWSTPRVGQFWEWLALGKQDGEGVKGSREMTLFIGTRFSNLYTAVDTRVYLKEGTYHTRLFRG